MFDARYYLHIHSSCYYLCHGSIGDANHHFPCERHPAIVAVLPPCNIRGFRHSKDLVMSHPPNICVLPPPIFQAEIREGTYCHVNVCCCSSTNYYDDEVLRYPVRCHPQIDRHLSHHPSALKNHRMALHLWSSKTVWWCVLKNTVRCWGSTMEMSSDNIGVFYLNMSVNLMYIIASGGSLICWRMKWAVAVAYY